eukprot:gnl/MRDRNA2_/MRDRNA2_93435_c0_seq1.p1 gnl/MRDRNA2_/MRDRNA2_93435_c0~~gnl/MRDRNA2_/MRDRNA2_93435_c0_seq1.p1  ORF type:complete len:728 (+),score=266.72 gnl/MRDRNA2_/MRDRNA2_93435_c0_seq1:111-2294(+)
MVHLLLSIAFFVVGDALKANEEADTSPIRKVVKMMNDMKLQLEKEAKEEAELFEKALCMCDGGEEELKKTIAHLTGEVDRLTSKQEAEKAERKTLLSDLDAHKADLAETKKSLYEAEEIRMKDAKKYSDDEMMNQFSVDSITQALRLFEKEGSAASFVQQGGTAARNFRRIIEVSRFLTPANREKVLEFLDQGSEAPGEMSSGVAQIVGVLKGMKDEIAKNMVDDKNEEHQAKEDFKAMKESKLEHIGVLEKTIADKKKRAGDLRLSIAQDHDALLDAETELLDSNNYLKNLASECASKKKMKDMRAKMKADEILAVGEAIAILTEDSARDTLTKAQPPSAAFLQPGQDYEAFVQVSQTVQKEAAPHNLLRGAYARDLGLHQHQSSGAAFVQKPNDAGEFAGQAEKVVHFMINNMVEVLHNDDVNDENKKDFCANETEAYYQLEQEKIHTQEQLTATIDKNTGELKMVMEDIKMLEESIFNLDKEVSLATEIRKKEHKDFVNEFATMETARRLIDKAANRLQKFYNPKQAAMKEEGAFETFVQTSTSHKTAVAPPPMMETPGEYEKNPGGNKIIGMMNEIKAEMTADMREAETDEKYSVKDYMRQMKDAVEDRAASVKALHGKEATKAKLEEKITQDKELRVLTLKELEEINLYQIELHSECDFLLRNFDARHGARVEEEVGLESAETIVTHETPPSHGETAEVFDEEHSKKQVEEHFPEQEMPAPR